MITYSIWIFFVFCLANGDIFSYAIKNREITSVAGTVGHIPCVVDTFQDVVMILWFKDSSGTPIYSYDGRNEVPRHLPLKNNDLGLRLHFRVPTSSNRPPALLIRDLQLSDAGNYRCRIDYRNSPTTNTVIRLTVIQPPTHLEIQDTSRSRPISDQQMMSVSQSPHSVLNDITYMGPYLEGQNVTIVCSAYGGLPMPEVIWYRNGLTVDGSYELVGNNYVTNELSITQLDRNHSHDLYTCQASNNNETKPISHRVNVDVYTTVKHIEVEIPAQMTAGGEYSLLCLAAGAYPSVKMEFWKVQRRIGPKYQIKSDADNITIYTIKFQPEVADDEAIVTCRAENPWISNNFMEAGRKLRVVYSPIVVLRFGSSKTTNFSEGESALLECHAKSNPPIHSITWFHQGKQLFDSITTGIQLNGMTLVLRHLTHLSGGGYSCEVSNDIGKGVSNTLHILLNISPKCSSSKPQVIPLAVGESHPLACSILAWPPDLNFYWTLNRSSEILPLSSLGQVIRLSINPEAEDTDNSRFPSGPVTSKNLTLPSSSSFGTLSRADLTSTNNPYRLRRKNSTDVDTDRTRHQSVLFYEIRSERDYGLVGCWAKNSYGKQLQPCLFHLMSRDEVDERMWDHMGKEGREINLTRGAEGSETLLSKLHGSPGIILMGVLIFMAGLCLVGLLCYLVRRGQRARPSTSIPAQPTTTETTLTHTSVSITTTS